MSDPIDNMFTAPVAAPVPAADPVNPGFAPVTAAPAYMQQPVPVAPEPVPEPAPAPVFEAAPAPVAAPVIAEPAPVPVTVPVPEPEPVPVPVPEPEPAPVPVAAPVEPAPVAAPAAPAAPAVEPVPVASPKRVAEAEPAAPSPKKAKTMESSGPVVNLPGGWNGPHMSQSKGKEYYYHDATATSIWTKPPELSIPTLYKMKRKQLVALAKKFDLNTQAKNADLIQSLSPFGTMTGWTGPHESTSKPGKNYYFFEATEESVWIN